mmetsp:Transcript_23558/g.58372  ORF Transcript_23558/g.58372 Transcript_23558/m.58372 type:complete len:225 (+) Transcript_23558:313-987(+)
MRSLPFFARARSAAPKSAGPSASASRAAADKFRNSSSPSSSSSFSSSSSSSLSLRLFSSSSSESLAAALDSLWSARLTVIRSSSSSAPSTCKPKCPPPVRFNTPADAALSSSSSSESSSSSLPSSSSAAPPPPPLAPALAREVLSPRLSALPASPPSSSPSLSSSSLPLSPLPLRVPLALSVFWLLRNRSLGGLGSPMECAYASTSSALTSNTALLGCRYTDRK